LHGISVDFWIMTGGRLIARPVKKWWMFRRLSRLFGASQSVMIAMTTAVKQEIPTSFFAELMRRPCV
jgi:hypothetical protein